MNADYTNLKKRLLTSPPFYFGQIRVHPRKSAANTCGQLNLTRQPNANDLA
jgi:hypothetical protein